MKGTGGVEVDGKFATILRKGCGDTWPVNNCGSCGSLANNRLRRDILDSYTETLISTHNLNAQSCFELIDLPKALCMQQQRAQRSRSYLEPKKLLQQVPRLCPCSLSEISRRCPKHLTSATSIQPGHVSAPPSTVAYA